MQRAVVWFPHNPIPPRTGAHERCLSLLGALRELGWSSVLLSSDQGEPWTSDAVVELTKSLVREVRIYETPAVEWRIRGLAMRWANLRAKLGRPSLDSWAIVPPGERVWSRRQVESFTPDLLLSSYAQFDPLVPHFDFLSIRRMIDNIDIVSASQTMWSELAPTFLRAAPVDTSDIPDEMLSPAFLSRAQSQLSKRELRIYDRYTDLLAINATEGERISAATSRTAVHYVPMTANPSSSVSTYEGPPLFVGARNPFNLQGLLWFARHVLPKVRRQLPEFVLDAVGSTFVPWSGEPGIALHGYVDDLEPFYARAGFAICPLLAGTGSQVKIIDAMANGLAVVATRQTAISSPIVDGVNGYVVDGPDEFADRTVALSADLELRRSLGAAARETIATDYSPARTVLDLERVLKGGQ